MKDKNQTTVILGRLNEFKGKQQNLNGFNQKQYLIEILLTFQNLLVVMTSQQND